MLLQASTACVHVAAMQLVNVLYSLVPFRMHRQGMAVAKAARSVSRSSPAAVQQYIISPLQLALPITSAVHCLAPAMLTHCTCVAAPDCHVKAQSATHQGGAELEDEHAVKHSTDNWFHTSSACACVPKCVPP